MSGAMGARPSDAPQSRQPQPPQVPPPPRGTPGAAPTAEPAPPAQPPPHHPPQAYPAPAPTQQGNAAVAGGPDAGQTATAVRRPRTGASSVPRLRQARLRVARVDPWSVMKVGFLLSIALGICTVAAVAVLWLVMDAMGVFSTVGGMVSDATSTDDGGGFDLEQFLSLPRVLGFTGVVAAINVVLVTALATLGSFVYNFSGSMVGGVEVTLVEDE